MSSPTNNWR